jgi:hypothetical protein
MKQLLLTALLSAAVLLADRATSADLRDPMRPPSAPVAVISRPGAPPSLQLQAVISTGASRVAIVDGKLVRVGDKVAGAVIDEISTTSIRYTRGGKQLVASLPDTKLDVRVNKTLQAGQP